MTLVVVIALLLFLVMGAPLFAVLIGAGAYGATATAIEGRTFWQDFSLQISDVFSLGTGEPATVLSTIPLFIFAGYVMAESKTADRLLAVARPGLGWLPGGLSVVAIVACALFTTFTGASGVTIVALGGLLMPALLKEGYPERFALGLVGGTGSVGLLFPPAVPLIVYGTIYGFAAQSGLMGESGGTELQLIDFSTDRFLFAGIVPGMVLVAILCAYTMFFAWKNGIPRQKFDLKACLRAAWIALPEGLLPVAIILGLRFGLGLPEVASLSAIYIVLVEVVLYRDVKVGALFGIIRESMALVGAIFIIVFAAQAFTAFLVLAGAPQAVFQWITSFIHSKWVFLLALNGALLVVGMTMDIFSAIVVVVPLIAPAATGFGIDPFHLGVIFLLNLEIGYLTPPVGLNLFITSFAFRRPILTVTRATFPFLACMVVALAVVTYVPALTVVPAKERRGLVSPMLQDAVAATQRLSAVDSIQLPDGKALRQADCKALEDPLDQELCQNLFLDVTKCRKLEADAATECETAAVKEYTLDTEDEEWED